MSLVFNVVFEHPGNSEVSILMNYFAYMAEVDLNQIPNDESYTVEITASTEDVIEMLSFIPNIINISRDSKSAKVENNFITFYRDRNSEVEIEKFYFTNNVITDTRTLATNDVDFSYIVLGQESEREEEENEIQATIDEMITPATEIMPELLTIDTESVEVLGDPTEEIVAFIEVAD